MPPFQSLLEQELELRRSRDMQAANPGQLDTIVAAVLQALPRVWQSAGAGTQYGSQTAAAASSGALPRSQLQEEANRLDALLERTVSRTIKAAAKTEAELAAQVERVTDLFRTQKSVVEGVQAALAREQLKGFQPMGVAGQAYQKAYAPGAIAGQGEGMLGGRGDKLSGAIDRVSAVLSKIGHYAGIAGRVGNAMSSPFLLPGDKFDAFLTNVVPGGSGLKELRDFLTGEKTELSKQAYLHGLNLGAQGLRHQGILMRGQYEMRTFAPKARAQAFGDLARRIEPYDLGDRSTLAGEIAFQEQQRRQPHLAALQTAQTELAAATHHRQLLENRLTNLRPGFGRGDLTKLAQREGEAERDWFTHTSGLGAGDPLNLSRRGVREAGYKATLAENAALTRQTQIEQTLKALESARVDEITKQNAVRKIGVDLQREELAIARSKEGRLTQTATHFGGLMQWQQQQVLEAARRSKDRDFASLDPYTRGLLQQHLPGYAQKRAEISGEASPFLRQLQKEGYAEQGRLAEQRKLVQGLEASVRVELAVNEASMAAAIEKALEHFSREFMTTFKNVFDLKIQRIERDLRMGQRGRAGGE